MKNRFTIGAILFSYTYFVAIIKQKFLFFPKITLFKKKSIIQFELQQVSRSFQKARHYTQRRFGYKHIDLRLFLKATFKVDYRCKLTRDAKEF